MWNDCHEKRREMPLISPSRLHRQMGLQGLPEGRLRLQVQDLQAEAPLVYGSDGRASWLL